jgi:hypothetical protein
VNQYFIGLKSHPKTSTSFSCEVCDKQFPTKTQLKKRDDLKHKSKVSKIGSTKSKLSFKRKSSPNLNFRSSNIAILSEQQLHSDMSGMESFDDSLTELPSPKTLKPGLQQPIIDLESNEPDPQDEATKSSTPTPEHEKAPAPPLPGPGLTLPCPRVTA